MPRRKLNSTEQDLEQTENQRRRWRSRSTPIACVVCERVFFDNVSLVLHSECHLNGEVSIPSQQGSELAPLQSSRPFPLSPSPYPSSLGRNNEARCVVLALPSMNAPCPPPVSSAITPNPTPRDASLVHIPVRNSMPPVNSSFDTQLNVSQPIHPSTVSPYGPTSSSSRPLMFSQSGERSLANGSMATPCLQLHNGGESCFSNDRNLRTNQPIPEIIVISDDEEDGKENADEIDLTLKL